MTEPFSAVLYHVSGELNANRPVPFRLTPNIAEFLTMIGVTGPLTAAMLVTARCFVYPPYKISSYLAVILRDEYITWHKKVFLSAVSVFLYTNFALFKTKFFVGMCENRISVRFRFLKPEPKPKGQT